MAALFFREFSRGRRNIAALFSVCFASVAANELVLLFFRDFFTGRFVKNMFTKAVLHKLSDLSMHALI